VEGNFFNTPAKQVDLNQDLFQHIKVARLKFQLREYVPMIHAVTAGKISQWQIQNTSVGAIQEAAEDAAARERAAKEAAGLKPIYFDFDKSFVRDDAKGVMKANADYLKANPKVKVRIEGNCDERGTIEYNQALGQRRASSTKKYLTDMGVSGKRISLISYGKEKPVCRESTEDCWQQNRRADLVAAE